jgi:hypothetical protein
MKDRSILSAAILIVFLFATNCKAQTCSAESIPRFAAFVPEVKNPASRTAPAAPIRTKEISDARTLSAVRLHKKQFLILSVAVYGASLADMHQTLKERKYSWWYETDPLAKHLVKLPAPGYYAAGLADGHRAELD